MSKFTRPTFNVDDDDLERLQEEFFAGEQIPSAKVIRKPATTTTTISTDPSPRKRSLFAERLAQGEKKESSSSKMPSLENSTPLPSLEDPSQNENDQIIEYEPVIDPNPEPHVPVSKKMLDLTSMLGQVLGEITEHDIDAKVVRPPTLPALLENKPAHGHTGGFPKPAHRSEFKRRMMEKRVGKESKPPRPENPPQVTSTVSDPMSSDFYAQENDRRIREMSEQELMEAREEIMNTLSPESIALLMKGLKTKNKKNDIDKDLPEQEVVEKSSAKKKVSFAKDIVDKKEEDLLEMKNKYFPDVPLENDKLAWMDSRFLTPELKEQEEEKEKLNEQLPPSEAEKVYRKIRFDLQGRIMDPNVNIPSYQGLHHHGDEPDKAGYTLAELFYLTRSQVPSQRSMVLTTIARIIKRAKRSVRMKEGSKEDGKVWSQIWSVFTGKEHAAAIYLRSALDDRHLVVLVSAIQALYALIIDENDDEEWEETVLDVTDFCRYLGHLSRPILPAGTTKIKRKGLNDKLSELVDRVRQQTSQDEQEKENDAELAERDLIRGLVKMNLLPRIRYLLASDSSELIEHDPPSVDRLVRILVRMAEAGQDVCEAIEEEDILEPVVEWGLLKTSWPMTTDNTKRYPSLAAVRLLTLLAQGSKKIAEGMIERAATITLRFLVTSPEIADSDYLKQRAYALQLETLRLVHVLACYGFILPTLEDLQGPVMDWLRAALNDHSNDKQVMSRASMAIHLLEILLHLAADPHKSIPAHAIDWHQPTAYLPAITAVLRASRREGRSTGLLSLLYESALGYLSAWATYIELFPPEPETVREVWKAVIEEKEEEEKEKEGAENSKSVGYTVSSITTNYVLRYIQFLTAYASLHPTTSLYRDLIEDAERKLKSEETIALIKTSYSRDMLGRYALWLWLKHCENERIEFKIAALESGVKSKQMGLVETWLAQSLLQLSLSNQLLNDDLKPFYLDHNEEHLIISKSLFSYDSRPIKTLMYTDLFEDLSDVEEKDRLQLNAFILSPIDALYHLDKSKVAQKSRVDAATLVSRTMKMARELLKLDSNMGIIALMKIFLIGDREGRQTNIVSTDREIFWDDRVIKEINEWMDIFCITKTSLKALEIAWRLSSEYIRQAQVPFFQFYQAFVAQYAAVSLGHHGFARLLVYLVSQIDTIDYRHLVFSDYRDILPTLNKVNLNEIPPLSESEREALSDAGLKLL
ncbi:uncharacterized protein BX663DRAFT_498743 [Cokeromyces recurvatus]|uniref:uncharacterized protein n=1 Tax=Cokeromyces recurvatus TaxID=90255 RepID=UPI00221EB251|nr:uncharacterized protein BX663DRAFT_498743 [Cokeromyces recurvatus]KAI7906088.1 hypothetical protein BX663DRAFT_498743 [Cokeromyces recurvatus]